MYIFFVVNGFPEESEDSIERGPWCDYIDRRKEFMGADVGYVFERKEEAEEARRSAVHDGLCATKLRVLSREYEGAVTWLTRHA